MTRCRDQRSDALDKQVILSLAGWSRMVGGFIRLLRTSGNLKASKSLILEFSNSLRLRLTENRASVHPLSVGLGKPKEHGPRRPETAVHTQQGHHRRHPHPGLAWSGGRGQGLGACRTALGTSRDHSALGEALTRRPAQVPLCTHLDWPRVETLDSSPPEGLGRPNPCPSWEGNAGLTRTSRGSPPCPLRGVRGSPAGESPPCPRH